MRYQRQQIFDAHGHDAGQGSTRAGVDLDRSCDRGELRAPRSGPTRTPERALDADANLDHREVAIYRVRDGRIVEGFVVANLLDVATALGQRLGPRATIPP
jgi:hypothetical protein